MKRRNRNGRRGFSLLEALLALLLASILFAGISLYTGSWLKRWQELIGAGSHLDTVAIVIDRLVEDLEAAQPLPETEDAEEDDPIFFEGDAETVTFLRPALGFNARAGIDRITYLRTNLNGSAAIVRSRRDYGDERSAGEDLPLIRGRIALSFSYTDDEGETSSEWHDRTTLPKVINVEISGSEPRPWREIAVAHLRVEMPANCGTAEAFPNCKEHFRAARQ